MHRRALWLGLLTVSLALAPAPQNPASPFAPQSPAAPATSASLRIQAGVKAYDMAWLYYSENRIQADTVYRWSKRLLEAEREASLEKANQVAACEGHLERIKRLEAKIRKIRRIGFGDSLDVVEADYYRKEADFWLDQAKASK